MPSDITVLDERKRNRFRTGVSEYQASRINKLRRGHVKLAYSKILELAARRLGIGIGRTATLFWDRELNVMYPEPASLALSRYGFYEEGLTSMVLEHLNPGMTFLDIGAHIGYFTLLAEMLVGESGQVHSFEPTPSTFAILKSNAGMCHNVHLNEIGVAARAGTVIFQDFGTAYSGYNSMYRARMTEKQRSHIKVNEFEAPTISVDEYVMREKLTPDFIKIDAESAELEILHGMEQTIRDSRPIISLEVGDMDIEGVISSSELVQYVVNKGYRPHEFDSNGIAKHLPKERYDYDNILFLP